MAKPIPVQYFIKAREGEAVMVRNYRMRPPCWESGIVQSVATHWRPMNRTDPTPRNRYTVLLDRKSARGTYMHLYVGDDDINREATA